MNRSEILSVVALAAGITAMITALITAQSGRTELAASLAVSCEKLQRLMDGKVEQAANELRNELVDKLDAIIVSLDLDGASSSLADDTDLKTLVQLAKTDPATAKLLKEGIESVILKQMADELGNVDWLDTLSQEKLQRLLKRTANASTVMGFNHSKTRIDVSDIEGVGGKIDRILEEFEGVNSYSSDNALIKQMAEMGDEAIEPLLKHLSSGGFGSNWAANMAVTETLEKLLTPEHEDLILEEFTKNGHFSKLISKYQFPAAENEVMNKISYPTHGHVDQNVVDAALRMNAERSIPLLTEHVRNGQNVSYAAKQLLIEGIDITEPLQMAAIRANSVWEKAQLVDLCLDQGVPEGYDLAIHVLRSNEAHAEHHQKTVYNTIREYTGASGTYEEVADWLEQNRTTIQ